MGSTREDPPQHQEKCNCDDGPDQQKHPVRRPGMSGQFQVEHWLQTPEYWCEQHGHDPAKRETDDKGNQQRKNRFLPGEGPGHLAVLSPRLAISTRKFSPMPTGVIRCLSWRATLA